jgi:hypothetical protein
MGKLGFRGRTASPEEQAKIFDAFFFEGARHIPYLRQYLVLMLLSATIRIQLPTWTPKSTLCPLARVARQREAATAKYVRDRDVAALEATMTRLDQRSRKRARSASWTVCPPLRRSAISES